MTHTIRNGMMFIAVLALILTAVPAPVALAGDDMAETTFTIKGMTCGGCLGAVKAQLKKTPGVTAYEVSLEKGEADVTYDAKETDPEAIAKSISKTGFEAKVKGADEQA